MNMVLVSLLAFILAIGILVAVHEWGHYIVARLAGVKVLRFSIGFGRPLWLRRAGPDGTEYCISSIPLGGYVKLLDEREGFVSPRERHRTFNAQSITRRIAILVAGPLMNFVFAIVAFWAMFVAGVPGLAPVIGNVGDGSIAASAGIRSGERIVGINGRPVATWEGAVLELLDALLDNPVANVELRADEEGAAIRMVQLDIGDRLPQLTEPGALLPGLGLEPWSPVFPAVIGEIVAGGSAAAAGMQAGDTVVAAGDIEVSDWGQWVEIVRARPGESLDVLVRRAGSDQRLRLAIGAVDDGSGNMIGRIGAAVAVPEGLYDRYRAEQRYRAGEALDQALARTWSMSALTVRMVTRMFTGDVSVKNISGPINIAQFAGYSASIGLASFLNFLAVVSLSLGILNLLPIPVLDGGQVVYQVAEALKGKPLSERAQILGQQIGIAFLVLVMSFAFYNDLSRLFS